MFEVQKTFGWRPGWHLVEPPNLGRFGGDKSPLLGGGDGENEDDAT